jgi:uncharacterized protein (DUF305 family)
MRILKITVLTAAAMALTNPVFSQDKSQSGAHGSASSPHGNMAGMHGGANASKASLDVKFLDTMSMHHEHGIKMAELVESRASHDELKAMAKKMIGEQQQEIKQMQAMKQKLGAGTGDATNMHMPGMKESMKGMDAKMQKLEASKGAAFERMFLDMMSKHHQDAMKMARGAVSKAQSQEIKDMAKKMSESQREDIAQMAAWKKEWKLAGK